VALCLEKAGLDTNVDETPARRIPEPTLSLAPQRIWRGKKKRMSEGQKKKNEFRVQGLKKAEGLKGNPHKVKARATALQTITTALPQTESALQHCHQSLLH